MNIIRKIYQIFSKKYNFYSKKKFEELKIQNSETFFLNMELNLDI